MGLDASLDVTLTVVAMILEHFEGVTHNLESSQSRTVM